MISSAIRTKFTKKTSINKKILFPFIVIIILLACISTILTIFSLSEIIQKDHQRYLLKESQIVQSQFKEMTDTLALFTHSIKRYRSPDEVSASILEETRHPILSSISVIRDRETLSPEQEKVYGSFFDSEVSSSFLHHYYFDFTLTNPHLILSFSSKRKLKNRMKWLITELKISPDFLLNSPLNTASNLVLFMKDKETGRVQLLTNSGLVKEQLGLQKELKKTVQSYQEANQERIYQSVIKGHSFSYVMQSFSEYPSLYFSLIRDSKDIFFLKLKIISIMAAVLFLSIFIIYFIYAIIIKQITSSIDILSAVSEKVADGDLDQRIYCDSSDEIGELSSIFNQMVHNLKESSQNLTYEKERSEAIISCIPEGIIVTDLENRLILANQKAEQMFNFQSNQVQGKVLLEYLNNEDLTSILQKPFNEKNIITSEIKIPDKHETDHIYTLSSSLVSSKSGIPIGVISILRDITYEKQIEELREGFLRTVSHELRTPLTSVIGFIELVTKDTTAPISEEQQSFLDTALKEAANLKTLIDDLLDLSQLKAGKTKMRYQEINVYDTVMSLITSLSPLAKGKQLELRTSMTDHGLVIQADATKFRRILLNLVSNSIKFTQKGFIEISCKEKKRSVEISVQDTGIGLKENEQSVIFEKFRQVDYSSTRKYEGIGLGLSIVKELVEMHGGTISVKSKFGEGSTFTFTLAKEPLDVS